MAIYQINVWICEVCGRSESTITETSIYDDPVVRPPKEERWDFITVKLGEEKLACPSCVEKHEKEKEKTDPL